MQFLNSKFPGQGKKRGRQGPPPTPSSAPAGRQASIKATHDVPVYSITFPKNPGPVRPCVRPTIRPSAAMVGGMSPPRRTLSMGSGGAMGRRAASAGVMGDSPKRGLSRSM